MKKVVFFLLGLFFSLHFGLLAGESHCEMTAAMGKESGIPIGEYAPGQVVVVVRPGVSEEEVRTLAAKLKAQVQGRLPEYRLYLLELPPLAGGASPKAQVEEAIEFLKKQPEVEGAFPNYKFGIPEPVGPISPRKPGGGDRRQ